MAQDHLRSAFEAIKSRLQSELDTHLAALEEQHAERLASTRRESEAQAEQRLMSQADALRQEWEGRLLLARSEAQERLDAETRRLREAAERESASAIARMRDEHESAMAAARARSESELNAERERARAALDAEREQLTAALESERSTTAGLRETLTRIESELSQSRDTAGREHEQLTAALESERSTAAGLRETLGRIESELSQSRDAAGREREQLAAALDVERTTSAGLRENLSRFESDLARSRDATATELEQLRAAFETERATVTSLREHLTRVETDLLQTRRGLEEERDGLAAALQSERASVVTLGASLSAAEAALSRARDESSAAVTGAQAALETSARVSERQSQLAALERLLEAVRKIGQAPSLSDTLAALVDGAAGEAPRAALFMLQGGEFKGWRATGFADPGPVGMQLRVADGGLLAEAVRSGDSVSTSSAAAPAFAVLPSDRAAMAVPIVVGSQIVGVLYADDGAPAGVAAPASWPEAVQILGRHASSCLAYLTAVRTAQALRGQTGAVPNRAAAPSSSEEDHGARRYARLLVSEIKLYNESAVRAGREKRDLLDRLRPEIDRARRLYEERVPPSVGARSVYFHQELVQTLADGDATLLGKLG